MHTKLTKFVFSQLDKRRNLWNLRFNELYLLSANPPGISHINIYSFKKSCIHAISKRIYSTMDAESVHVVFKVANCFAISMNTVFFKGINNDGRNP